MSAFVWTVLKETRKLVSKRLSRYEQYDLYSAKTVL